MIKFMQTNEMPSHNIITDAEKGWRNEWKEKKIYNIQSDSNEPAVVAE